jgi:hypothetical protein
MIILAVQRGKGWRDKIRKYRILIDGVEIGRLAEGETIIRDVEDGSHVLEARIDWCGSPQFRFEARSEHVVVTVRSAHWSWRAFFFPFYTLFINRHEYLALEIAERKLA